MTAPMLLFDTNVWLDFFLDRSAHHDVAGALVAEANRHDATILTPVTALKDIYFLITLELKRMEREANGSVTESFANAINEVAWACIKSMRRQSVIVGADATDMVEAIVMRPTHPDFEDNLIAAALVRSHADFLVTSDKSLLHHQPVPCLSIDQAIDLLRGFEPRLSS